MVYTVDPFFPLPEMIAISPWSTAFNEAIIITTRSDRKTPSNESIVKIRSLIKVWRSESCEDQELNKGMAILLENADEVQICLPRRDRSAATQPLSHGSSGTPRSASYFETQKLNHLHSHHQPPTILWETSRDLSQTFRPIRAICVI